MIRKRVPWHLEFDRSGRVIRTLYRPEDTSVVEALRSMINPSKPEPAPKVARGVQGNLL